MDGNRIAAVVVAVLMVTSMVAVPGTVAAQSDQPDATEPAAYYGSVTVDGDPAPNGTEVAVAIDGEVRDSLVVNETGQYGGPDLFDEKLTVDAADPGDEVEFLVDGEPVERTDPEPVEWEEGDVQQVDLLGTIVDPIYEIESVDAPETVTTGDDVDLTVGILNTGTAGEANVTVVDGDNDPRATITPELDANESVEEVISVPTGDDDGDSLELTVETADDTAEPVTVDLEDAANFDVDLEVDDADSDFGVEDTLSGTVSVDNTGDQSDEQEITVTLNDREMHSESVELDGSDQTTIEFSDIALDRDDAGESTVEAASEDDDDSVDITVLQPATFTADVIEDESDLDVVAGQTVTVVAEIENVGDETAEQTVTLSNVTDGADEELDTEDIELSDGELQDFVSEFDTDSDDVGNLTLEVDTGDETRTVDVTVEDRPSFLDVTIDEIDPDDFEEPEPSETKEIDVNVTVENLGTEGTEQTITFTANGEEFASENIDVGGTSSETLNETLTVETGDAPEIDIRVESEDDTEEATLDVTPLAEFDVSIVEASNVTGPVPDDGGFAPEIKVTNVGEQDGDVSIEVLFDGHSAGNFSASDVHPGDEVTLVEENDGFEINVSESGLNVSDGDRLLEAVATNDVTDVVDDSSTDRVTVGEAADFEVETIDLGGDDTVDRGDEISVDVTIENTGEVDGEKPVFVELGDREIAVEDFNVSGGETESETFTFTARSGDIGTNDLTVTTPDDEDSETVTVREDAEFVIDDFEIDEDAIAGETIEATVDVENEGGVAGNQTDVRLSVDGADDPDSQSVELDRDESTEVTFEITPDDAGTLEATVATDDDFDTATTEVGTSGELVTEIRSVTDPIEDGEAVDVSVRVENVGDGEIDGETVRLRFDGSIEDTTDVTLDGGESDRITLTTTVDLGLDEGDSVEETVEVLGGTETVSEAFTVEELEGPYFRLSSLDIDDDDVLNQSQTLTATANVTNVGDETGTQDITFTIGDVTETNESVELDEGDETSVSFDFDPTNVGETGAVDYTIESDDQEATDTLEITEPTPGTPAIDNVDFDGDATQGEAFEATVTIENVGDLDLDGNETVTLDAVDGTELVDGAAERAINESEMIAPGDTEDVTLSVTPEPEPRAGAVERTFEVSTDDGEDTVSETVTLDFEGISSGLDALGAGEDTVLVEPGTYDERSTITIDTDDVTIEPTEGDVTIKPPRGDDETAVSIEASGVELSDLTFAGDGTGTAVELADGADDVTLTDLRIEDWETGVDETAGTNTYVGLDIVDVDAGIVLAGDDGSEVRFTRVARADDTGILVDSNDVEIFASDINRATVGIDAFGQATIEETTVRNAEDYGVRVTDVPGDLATDPSVSINNSALESNALSLLADNSSVEAEFNWWGSDAAERGFAAENVEWAARSDVAAENASESRAESDLTVTVDSEAPAEVVRGETFDIDATIENEGTATDRQQIELVDDGTVLDDTELNLSDGESESVTLSYEPDATDSSLDLEVRSLDDEAGAPDETVDVVDPAAFTVDITDADTDVPLGNDLDVEVDVENTGGVTGTATLELLDFDGNTVDTATDVEIDNGSIDSSTLTWTTDQTGTDDLTVEVSDDDGNLEDSVTETVTVEDAALDDVALALDDASLTAGDTTTADVEATFTDGSTSDVTSSAGITSTDTDVATVSGAEITAESAGTTTIEAEYTEDGETETATVTLSVDEDDAPTFTGGGGIAVPAPTEDIELETTASESASPELDPETDRQVVAFDDVETVSEISFDTADALDDVAVGDVDPATDDVTPPGAGATISEIAVPNEATDTAATIEFRVSVDRIDEIGADADDLTAFRAVDSEWESLETTVETDGEDAVVTAETPGFSVFAVSATSPPDAAASVMPESATEGEEVTLDGSDSTNEYGEIVSYDWTVDGETLSGETATLTPDEPGEYTAELTVMNDAGETDTATAELSVTAVDDDAPPDDDAPDDDVPDDPDEEAFGTGTIAVIVLIIVAVLAAAGVAVRRREN